ncbi:MAG: hypothetical protein A2498_08960 [Lentisphaerae bacterium RIFOXYC12_FULL_60_16]|nr:MAG: hypothetical protein A2498_08960 [Lentisphaerae bacterium RIFOXYC12_FULL_60_16]OGV71653.1 MAG: hypothetical protein A2269_06950 [Lentisphaerae bacterium RIFOXYA12_FULL_60_10]OGV81051.1 MAG: hypothetical protein A2340_07325 [Lentisphaerae bacterium RIFOXYB12_FULL_60_10]
MKRDWISRETTVEVIVGSFIVMVLLGLAYFTIILSRETWFGTKFRMDVHFTDVMGLRDGDSVVARGMQVGKVKAMMLDTNQSGVKVVLTLDKQLQMRTDYRIQIETTSILGGRHMLIHEGAADHPMLPADALIRGQDPFNIMSDAAKIINEIRGGVVEGKMVDNLRDMIAGFREISDRLNRGEGTLGKLLSTDDVVYRDLSAAVASLKLVTDRLEQGEGTLGKFMQDDTLYRQVNGLLDDVRNAVDDFRETSPVVSFTSIFFGAL